MPEEFIKHVKQLGKADQQPDLLTLYDRKGKFISKSEIAGVEENYDNSNDGLDELDPPTTNNNFGLDPLPATIDIHGNIDIVDDDNNDTHNDNNIIIDNEDNLDNEKIHDDDDPQLYTTNDYLHTVP